MSKCFNINLGLEEMELEVDKVADAAIEDKTIPETEKVLDVAIAASEEPVSAPAIDEVPTNTSVKVPVEETPKVKESTDTPPAEDESLAPEDTSTEVTDPELEVDESGNAVGTEGWEEHLKNKLAAIKKLQADIPHIKAKIAKEKEAKKKKISKEGISEYNRFIISIEELNDELVVTAPVVPVETPAETVAVALEEPETAEVVEVTDNAPLVEIDDIIKENEDNAAQVDDALDVATSLEEIANELEESLETGGLTPIAASIVDIATTDLYSQVGIVKSESEVLATESFQLSSLRIRNTKMAIEDIKETIASIYKAIVAAIARAIGWIKKFINSFFTNFDSMNEKIDNLLKAFALIDKTAASKLDISNQKYDNETIINKLKSGKNGDPNQGVNNLVKFTENYFKNVETERSSAIKKIQSMISKLKDSDVTLPENIQLDFSLHGMIKGTVPGYKAGSVNLDSYVSNVVMPSDSEFIYFIPKDGLNDEEYLDAAKESKFLVGIKSDIITVDSIPYLMSSEVNSFLNNLSKICKVGNDSKVLFNNFIKDKEELSKELNNLMKTKSLSNIKFGSAIMTRIQMYDHTFISGSAALSKLMMNTLSAGIVYSTECVKVYTEAGKK